MGCVAKTTREFKDLARKHNLDANSLELIIHKYWIETGNEELFPSDVYIKAQLGQTQYVETGKSVRELWNKNYSFPKSFDSIEDFNNAKNEALKYFPADAIVHYRNSEGKLVLAVKQPVEKVDSKQEFFNKIDENKDTLLSPKQKAYNDMAKIIRDLYVANPSRFENMSIEELKQMIDKATLAKAEMEDIKAKAIANGTFMKAPNGKPTNLNEQQWLQVRTKAFKDWFGDWENSPENASKVVDENGEPLVVYHGGAVFSTFDINKYGSNFQGFYGKGFYFTLNKSEAKKYEERIKNGELKECFINIKSPTTIEEDSTELFDKDIINNDGVFVANKERVIVGYVAVNSNQVKSATDNLGSFATDNNDIQFAIGNSNPYTRHKTLTLSKPVIKVPRNITATEIEEQLKSEIVKIIPKYPDLIYSEKITKDGEGVSPWEITVEAVINAVYTKEKLDKIRQDPWASICSISNIYNLIRYIIADDWWDTTDSEEKVSYIFDMYPSLEEDIAKLILNNIEGAELINYNTKNTAIDNKNLPTADTIINIYAGADENAHLSNFAIRPFRHTFSNGAYKDFQSVEQAFQYIKARQFADTRANDGVARNGKAIEAEIMETTDGSKLRQLGKSIKELNVQAWDRSSSAIMKQLLKESFEQNPQALQGLLSTGNATLTHTQDKGKWGTEFPKLLMEVREELAKEKEIQATQQSTISPNTYTTRAEMLNAMYTDGDAFIGEVSQSPYTKQGNSFVLKTSTEVEKLLSAFSKRGVPKSRMNELLSDEDIEYLTEGKNQTTYYNIGYESGSNTIQAVTNRELFDSRYTPKTIAYLRDISRYNEEVIPTQISTFKDTSTFLVDANDKKAIEFFEKNGYKYKIYQVGQTSQSSISDNSLTPQLIDHLKSIGLNVLGRAEMENFLKKKDISSVQTMLIGEKGAANIDKTEETNLRISNLNTAIEMEKAGKDALTIKIATGWERGVDKKWRYEIEDFRLSNKLNSIIDDDSWYSEYPKELKLKDILYSKDIERVSKTYPELLETEVTLTKDPNNGKTANINTSGTKIKLSVGYDKPVIRRAIAHELQHYAQIKEGFTEGASPKIFTKQRVEKYNSYVEEHNKPIDEKISHKQKALEKIRKEKFRPTIEKLHMSWAEYSTIFDFEHITEYEDLDYYEASIDRYSWNKEEDLKLLNEEIKPILKQIVSIKNEISKLKTQKKDKKSVFYEETNEEDTEKYNNVAGEAEARTAEKRRKLSEEEKRTSLFLEDLYKDVAKEDLIFIQNGEIVNNNNNVNNENIVETFTTPQGEVYGFVDKDGKIYLDETAISPEHPIHEYTHLWDRTIAKNNPRLWNRGVTLMQKLSLWNEIANDANYGKVWESKGISGERLTNLIASEVHSRLTGKEGEKILNTLAKQKGMKRIITHLKQWIKDMWSELKSTFGTWTDKDLDNLSIDDFINMPIRDFAEGLNPNNQSFTQDNGITGTQITKALEDAKQASNDYDTVNTDPNVHLSENVEGTIEYTPTGKDRQKYTIKGTHIYNKDGKEVFIGESVDRNKILANFAIKQKKATVVEHRGNKYVVNDEGQIVSVTSGKVMKWGNENGDRKAIIALASQTFPSLAPSAPVRTTTTETKPMNKKDLTPQDFTFNDGTTVRTPFKLNDQQVDALNAMSDFMKSDRTTMTLSGYAGTGKTSIMEILAKKARKQRREIVFCASTNKAAAVLNERVSKSGFKATTLNKIFGIVVEVDKDKAYDEKNLKTVIVDKELPSGATVIIDEASMINTKNYALINEIARSYGIKIIYVGDEAQLAPVGESQISPVFRDGTTSVVRLTQVERTDDNAILKEATAIRNGNTLSGESLFNEENKGVAYVRPSHKDTIDNVIQEFVNGLSKNSNYFRILAFTNKAVEDYNKKVRDVLGYDSPIPKIGEPMIGYTNWGYNYKTDSYRFINSESYKVTDVGNPTTKTLRLIDGTIIRMEVVPITLVDSLGNIDSFDYIDIKENKSNQESAIILAKEKSRLFDLARDAKSEQKPAFYQAINAIDDFMFVNENIIEDGRVPQSKVIDYGYAMTVHKSQGSTFTNVLIDDVDIAKSSNTKDVDLFADEGQGINMRQQLEYVAVSRATDTVTIISNNVKTEGSPLNHQVQQVQSSEVQTTENTSEESTTETQEPVSTVEEASTSTRISLPAYQEYNRLDNDIEVDADWKIPYLQDFESRLYNLVFNIDDSAVTDNVTLKKKEFSNSIQILLEAESEEAYKGNEEVVRKEETNKQLDEYETFNTQLNNLRNNGEGLSDHEIRETAESVINLISDTISDIQNGTINPEEYFPGYKSDLDASKASREEIVTSIGITRFIEKAKENFSPEKAEYDDFDTITQAQYITDNWDALMHIAADVFALNEGFGISRNASTGKFETTKAPEIDINNVNDWSTDTDASEENEKDSQQDWQIDKRCIDTLMSMTDLVRKGIRECYLIDANGNKVLDKWGIPKRVNPRKATNKILKWTQGSMSMKDMIKKLQEKQTQYPWLSSLIDRLSATEGKENPNADFQSQFYNVFQKHLQIYSIVLMEDGKYKCIPVNENMARSESMRTIIAKFKMDYMPLLRADGSVRNHKLIGSIHTTNDADDFNIYKAHHYISDARESLSKGDTLSTEERQKVADLIQGTCNALGFTLTNAVKDEFRDFMNESSLKSMEVGLTFLLKALDNIVNRKTTEAFDPFKFEESKEGNTGIRYSIQQFISPITDLLEDDTTNSFYDSGKMYQSYVTPSFMSKLMNKFKLEKDDFVKFMIDEYAQSEWFKRNTDEFTTGWREGLWMEKLAKDIDGQGARSIFAHKVELKFDKHNYMRNMTDAEYAVSVIAEFFSEKTDPGKETIAWFRVPIQSNKPSSDFIRFYSYMDSNFKRYITKGLFSMYLQELGRINTVIMRNKQKGDAGFIENFDIKGRSFQFLPFLNAYMENTAEAKKKRTLKSVDGDLFATLLQLKSGSKIITAGEKVSISGLYQENSEGAVTLNSKGEGILREQVNSAIEEFMNNYSASVIEDWKQTGIFEAAAKSENILSEGERKLSKEEQERILTERLEKFIWNDAFASKNILQLTIGDIAYYKDAEDLQKRLAQLHAPGVRGNIDAIDYNGNKVSADGKYRTVLISDLDSFKSNIIANIAEVFDKKIRAARTEQEKASLEALKDSLVGEDGRYTKINVTDGQGYSSPTSYRKKAIMFGKWSREAEDIYQKLLSGNYTYTDLEIAFQPLKPFVYSHTTKNTEVGNAPIKTINVPFQAKNSEYLLIMADAILQGHETSRPNLLRAVYRVMEDSAYDGRTYKKDANGNYLKDARGNLIIENPGTYNGKGIDTVQFGSAIKSGLQTTINIAQFIEDVDGENKAYQLMRNLIYADTRSSASEERAYDVYNTDAFVQEMPFEDYCLQQEVPGHFRHHSQAHGSQIRMNIPSDLDYYTNDVDENGKKEINYYEWDEPVAKSKEYPNGVKHMKVTATEFKSIYERTIADNIQESIDDLKKELFIGMSLDKREQNLALSHILQREITSSPRYGIDLAEACQIDQETGEFRIPKGDPIQSKRIEQLINSIIKNRVNKQKIEGGPIVQVTNFGTTKQLHIRFKNANLISEENYNSSEHGDLSYEEYKRKNELIPLEKDYIPSEHGNKSYAEYLKENQGGISHFEVFIPIWNGMEMFIDKETGIVDIEAMDKVASELLKMVSYRIPTEDKYSMAPMKAVGFMPREAGDAIMLPYELTEIDDSDFDVDKRYVMRKNIPVIPDRNKIATILKTHIINAYKTAHNNTISKEQERELKNRVETFLNNRKSNDVKYFDALDQSLEREYQNIIDTNHDVWKPVPPMQGKLFRDNKIIDMSRAVLCNKMTADKILTPGGFEEVKHMGYLIEAFKNEVNSRSDLRTKESIKARWEELKTMSVSQLKELSYKEKDLTLVDSQIQFYRQNAAAASLVGVFAVNKVAHATLEDNGIMLDTSEATGSDTAIKIGNNTLEGLVELDPSYDRNGVIVGKSLGRLIPSATDAAKTPVLNLMNVNMTTAGLLTTMIRLGIPFEDASLFLSQSAIEHILNEFNRENLKGYKSLSSIIDARIARYAEKHGIDCKDDSAPIHTEGLSEEELIMGLIDPEYDNGKVAYKVLYTLRKIQKLADAVRKPTFATRFNSISNAVGPLIINNFITQHTIDSFSNDKNPLFVMKHSKEPVVFETIMEMHPILDNFRQTLYIAESLFKDMPAGSRGFKEIFNSMDESISEKLYGDKKLLDKFSSFYQSYMLIASGVINPSELASYVGENGNKGFAKEYVENEYDKKYPENKLIQAIKPAYTKTGIPYLTINLTNLDEQQKGDLRDAWIEIHKEDPELSYKLFAYSFFRAGIGFSPKTFMALVPVYVKERLSYEGKSYVNTFRHFPVMSIYFDTIIDQFMRNNWQDGSLVPYKEKVDDVDYVYDMKNGTLLITSLANIEDMKSRGNYLKYIKTKVGNKTYLWKRHLEKMDAFDPKYQSLQFDLVAPLGNNGEYLEIDTKDINKALKDTNIVVEEENSVSDIAIESPAEKEANNTAEPILAERKENIQGREKLVKMIMGTESSMTKNVANMAIDGMKKGEFDLWWEFFQKVFAKNGFDVSSKEKVKEVFNTFC